MPLLNSFRWLTTAIPHPGLLLEKSALAWDREREWQSVRKPGLRAFQAAPQLAPETML